MIHTVTLKENDFLTHQLYEASTNPLRIKRRNRDYITIVVFVVLFALICYLEGKDLLFYFAGIYAIVVILFGKSYLRWRYKKHYAKQVRITYKEFFEQETQIEITDDSIMTTDRTGETKINISEIRSVSELPNHQLITISTGQTLILPKQSEKLKEDIFNMIQRHNILLLDELDWKWR